jgi:hypothetical protein
MKPSIEINPAQFLPPVRRIVFHCLTLAAASFVVGPLIGVSFFNDPRGQPLSLSVTTVLVWGMAATFIASFCYVGWLILRARRMYRDQVDAMRAQAFERAISGDDNAED